MEAEPAGTFGLRDEDLETSSLSPGTTREDTSNSERFVKLNQTQVYYSPRRKSWMRFDKRWMRDDVKEVIERAKVTAREIYFEAARLPAEEAKKMGAWAESSLGLHRIEAMIKLAEPRMVIVDELLDADDWTLNCANGTLNLRNGEFHRHRKEDFLTKITGVEYDPAAQCPRWMEFLEGTFAGNAALIEYAQRLAGYFLTGCTTEQKWWMFFGPTASGKSTFILVLRGLLGEYAFALPENYFMLSRNESKDFVSASLAGVRLATCVETNEGKRLNVAKIKTLSGEDIISAEHKFERPFEFKPKCKLVLGTNYAPHVPAGDDALWRRSQILPFNVIVPKEKRIAALAAKLLDYEGPGILNWAYEGCRLWQSGGLEEPAAVVQAVNEYRSSEDLVADFVGDCIVLEAGARTLMREIYDKYKKWCDDEGTHQRSKKFLGAELKRLGIVMDTGKRHYLGVRTRQLGDAD